MLNVKVERRDGASPCAEGTHSSPKEFLLSLPRGAYVTARSVFGTRVFDLLGHVDTLVFTLKSLSFNSETDITTDDQIKSDKYHNSMSVVSLEPHCITSSLCPYRQAITLLVLLKDALLTGICEFKRMNHCCENDDVKLTIHVTYSFSLKTPVISVLVSSLPPPPSDGCQIELFKGMRKFCNAKDTQWIRERKSLEENKHDKTEEIVLYDEDGKLYEGISSNFFVLSNQIVYTAPDSDVLCGTMRRAILSLCNSLDIEVHLTHPRIDEINKWSCAFICSTSRQLLAVDRLLLVNSPNATLVQLPSSNSLMDQLKVSLAKYMTIHSYPITEIDLD